MYKTDKFTLKPLTKEYVSVDYLDWFHNSDINYYTSHAQFPKTIEDLQNYVSEKTDKRITFAIMAKKEFDEKQAREFADQLSIDCLGKDYSSTALAAKAENTFMICEKAHNKFPEYKHIGNISIQEIDYINRSAEIAFIIGDKDCWGKGIATTAGFFMLHHGFDVLNMNRIYLGTAALNEGMRKVAEKLKMRFEGVSRAGLYIDGQYQHIVHYSILKNEWEQIVNHIGDTINGLSEK